MTTYWVQLSTGNIELGIKLDAENIDAAISQVKANYPREYLEATKLSVVIPVTIPVSSQVFGGGGGRGSVARSSHAGGGGGDGATRDS